MPPRPDNYKIRHHIAASRTGGVRSYGRPAERRGSGGRTHGRRAGSDAPGACGASPAQGARRLALVGENTGAVAQPLWGRAGGGRWQQQRTLRRIAPQLRWTGVRITLCCEREREGGCIWSWSIGLGLEGVWVFIRVSQWEHVAKSLRRRQSWRLHRCPLVMFARWLPGHALCFGVAGAVTLCWAPSQTPPPQTCH